ncbi:MAG: hypothetical protein PHR44_03525 [Candidatus Omnitrophica bacterium]|nr:hypothetical protein [Candidatus Omnitrophota bacterium]
MTPARLFLCALSFSLLTSGCGLKEDRPYSINEAEAKFLQICEEEYKWQASTRLVDNTFWVYIPYEKDIFKYKANTFPQKSNCVVGYVDGAFSEGAFQFEYQISPLFRTEKDKGFTSGTIDELNEDFYNLLNVIYRVYFNAEKQPEFYVIVMADINNGVEIIYTIYNEDLRKIFNSAIASEEYYKRLLQEIRGNPDIVGDKAGRHLKQHGVKFTKFLADQVVQRIRIKFTDAETDFNLCASPEEEIFRITAYCMATYEFGGFNRVVINNITKGSRATKSRLELEQLKEL